MKRKFIKTVFFLASLLMIAGGCSKYDDGPVVSLYSKEKRVLGRWYFTKVMYNDVDSTSAYRQDPIQSIEFFINPDKEEIWNGYVWNRNLSTSGFGTARVDYGFWRLTDEKDSIRMVTTMSLYPDSETVLDTVQFKWKINRLAYTEFWMESMFNDTTRVEWHLWKPAY